MLGYRLTIDIFSEEPENQILEVTERELFRYNIVIFKVRSLVEVLILMFILDNMMFLLSVWGKVFQAFTSIRKYEYRHHIQHPVCAFIIIGRVIFMLHLVHATLHINSSIFAWP